MAREEVSIVIRARDLASRVFSGVAGGLKRVRVSAQGLRRAFLAVIASAGGMVFAFKKMFDAGSSVLETQSKFNTVFGESAERMDAFNKEFARTAGLTKTVGQELLATTGQIVQGLGFSTDASADFSKAVLRLAADLGSFNDVPTAETARAIQAALTGEREQLKRLGVVLRETDVQQRAFELTGKDVASTLTDQEKATASLQLITEKAGVAVGDLDRTQDSAANRARQVKAAFADQFNQLSTDLIPVLEQLLPLFQELADKAAAMTEQVAGFITTLFDLAGLTNATLREELRAFDQLPDEQKAGRVANLRGEIAGKRGRIAVLGEAAKGAGLGDLQGILDERKALQEETDQLQIALDVLETKMARLKDTSDETAAAVENVVNALKPGGPPALDALSGVQRGVVPIARTGIGGVRLGSAKGFEAAGLKGLQEANQLQVLENRAREAGDEVETLADTVGESFGNMAIAATQGSAAMERAVISTFERIISRIGGGGILGGLFGGLAGLLIGKIFGGGRKTPTPVTVERFGGEAVSQQREVQKPPIVNITIIDPRRNVREVLAELQDLEARDGVVRVPAIALG